MYRKIENDKAWRLISGGPIVMVSSVSSSGVPDVMSAAWNTAFNFDEPLVVLDTSHTTSENIRTTRHFAIAVPGADLLNPMLAAGTVHGRDVGDKFRSEHIAGFTSPHFALQIPTGCLAFIECNLRDEWYGLFAQTGILVGTAVHAAVLDELWDEEQESFVRGLRKTMHHVADKTLLTGGEEISIGHRPEA